MWVGGFEQMSVNKNLQLFSFWRGDPLFNRVTVHQWWVTKYPGLLAGQGHKWSRKCQSIGGVSPDGDIRIPASLHLHLLQHHLDLPTSTPPRSWPHFQFRDLLLKPNCFLYINNLVSYVSTISKQITIIRRGLNSTSCGCGSLAVPGKMACRPGKIIKDEI